jgi:hypothetical protein
MPRVDLQSEGKLLKNRKHRIILFSLSQRRRNMRGALVVAVAVATAVIAVADAAPPKPHIFMMIVDVRSASLQLATMHV